MPTMEQRQAFPGRKGSGDPISCQSVSERLPETTLISRVVEVCVRHLGTVEVAKQLGVTPVLVDLWQTGRAPMPKQSFLKLIDVLIALNPGWSDSDKK